MYKQSNSVITRQIAGDTLLIPITQVGVDLQKVYLLNETAAAIWELLQIPHSGDDLVKALQETYEAPEEVLSQDVEATVRALLDQGFLTEINQK